MFPGSLVAIGGTLTSVWLDLFQQTPAVLFPQIPLLLLLMAPVSLLTALLFLLMAQAMQLCLTAQVWWQIILLRPWSIGSKFVLFCSCHYELLWLKLIEMLSIFQKLCSSYNWQHWWCRCFPMGDIALPASCMDWSVFLHVERCQVLWKGKFQNTCKVPIWPKAWGGYDYYW